MFGWCGIVCILHCISQTFVKPWPLLLQFDVYNDLSQGKFSLKHRANSNKQGPPILQNQLRAQHFISLLTLDQKASESILQIDPKIKSSWLELDLGDKPFNFINLQRPYSEDTTRLSPVLAVINLYCSCLPYQTLSMWASPVTLLGVLLYENQLHYSNHRRLCARCSGMNHNHSTSNQEFRNKLLPPTRSVLHTLYDCLPRNHSFGVYLTLNILQDKKGADLPTTSGSNKSWGQR